MSIAKTVINKPTTILIIFVLLLGLSLYVAFQIPIDLIPEINPPYLVVYTAYSGAGPEEVEQNVTRPLESSLINVSNIKRMTSTSSEGVSMVMFEFDWVSDLNEASSEIRDRIEMVKNMLPDEVSTPQLFKFNPSMIPIMSLNISGERPSEDLREIAETQIQPFLEQVNGVASTSLSGGRERIIRVEISQN
ncbi:MAG: efflux RND transporter permease subunit, partial [Spirochaetales bacterium]|nr:efflux RND transporter permease subunit [Spirochaetales bacterium]